MKDFLDDFIFKFGNINDKHRNRDGDENTQKVGSVHCKFYVSSLVKISHKNRNNLLQVLEYL